MSVIIILIIIGVVVAGGFLVAFIWAVRDGQFDDDYTPSVRMLFDRENSAESTTDEGSSENQTDKQ